MLHGEALGLLVGAVALGAVHGVEPGHGWPVAATYALDQANKWLYGFAASLILGIGHLVSSIAMVAAFFYAKAYFELAEVNQPITVLGSVGVGSPVSVEIGGPVSVVAGVVLIALGIREYRHGHAHDHGHSKGDAHGGDHSHGHDHSHGDDNHSHHTHEDGQGHHHDHTHADGHDHSGEGPTGLWSRAKGFLPFVGGHSHDHHDTADAADRGLWGIAWFAFLLGFAHEEEFEIIALCAGSTYCLELMTAYALTVIVGIVGLTMLLIAGYERYEQRVERLTPYLPAFSAAVLVIMGLGFVLGLF